MDDQDTPHDPLTNIREFVRRGQRAQAAVDRILDANNAIEFRITPHLVTPHLSIIEVWCGGELVATIAPTTRRSVRFISNRAVTISRDDDPPPVIEIAFGQ